MSVLGSEHCQHCEHNCALGRVCKTNMNAMIFTLLHTPHPNPNPNPNPAFPILYSPPPKPTHQNPSLRQSHSNLPKPRPPGAVPHPVKTLTNSRSRSTRACVTYLTLPHPISQNRLHNIKKEFPRHCRINACSCSVGRNWREALN